MTATEHKQMDKVASEIKEQVENKLMIIHFEFGANFEIHRYEIHASEQVVQERLEYLAANYGKCCANRIHEDGAESHMGTINPEGVW